MVDGLRSAAKGQNSLDPQIARIRITMNEHPFLRAPSGVGAMAVIVASLFTPTQADGQAALPVGIPSINGRAIQIRFYESGGAAIALRQRLYATRFEASATRYVSVELELAFPALVQPVDFVVSCAYVKPDGSAFGSVDLRFNIPKDWTTASQFSAWGNAQGGAFAPGTYRVRCTSNSVTLAEGAFEVVTSPPAVEAAQARIASLKFFEAPTREGLTADKRKYADRFEAATSRMIFAELTFTGPKPGRVVEFLVDCVLVSPEGARTPAQYKLAIQPDWTGIQGLQSFGWDEPGKWSKGFWRLTCTLGGKPLIEQILEIA